MDEFDMGFEPDPMHGAQKVGGEHERTFENRHDQQILGLRGGDFFGESLGACGDRLFVVEDLNSSGCAQSPASIGDNGSKAAANLTIMSCAPCGGAASLVRKVARSPGPSFAVSACAVHTYISCFSASRSAIRMGGASIVSWRKLTIEPSTVNIGLPSASLSWACTSVSASPRKLTGRPIAAKSRAVAGAARTIAARSATAPI